MYRSALSARWASLGAHSRRSAPQRPPGPGQWARGPALGASWAPEERPGCEQRHQQQHRGTSEDRQREPAGPPRGPRDLRVRSDPGRGEHPQSLRRSGDGGERPPAEPHRRQRGLCNQHAGRGTHLRLVVRGPVAVPPCLPPLTQGVPSRSAHTEGVLREHLGWAVRHLRLRRRARQPDADDGWVQGGGLGLTAGYPRNAPRPPSFGPPWPCRPIV